MTCVAEFVRDIRKALSDRRWAERNLKDYPIAEIPNNDPQRGFKCDGFTGRLGVGRIKQHSPTYSGGLSPSYTRKYDTARHLGLEGFSR